MKTIEEKIEIYRAYLNGKQIEFTVIGQDYWQNAAVIPAFNWEGYDYRVKPEPPKQRVAYAFVSPKGFLEWSVDERYCSTGFVRCPEFDIIASNEGQE